MHLPSLWDVAVRDGRLPWVAGRQPRLPRALVIPALLLVGGCATPSRPSISQTAAAHTDATATSSAALPRHTQTLAPVSGTRAAPATSSVAALPVAVVPADYAAQRASIVEAVRTGTHPERLSLLIAPAPFDVAAYLRDPAAYLNVIEPGRVLQSADPAPGVPPLEVVGPDLVTIAELGTATLTVRTVPRGPASFASLDMGAFANGQSAITVQADDQGIAQTTYTATRGTIAQSRISVSSPVASGTRGYRIEITAAGTAP